MSIEPHRPGQGLKPERAVDQSKPARARCDFAQGLPALDQDDAALRGGRAGGQEQIRENREPRAEQRSSPPRTKRVDGATPELEPRDYEWISSRFLGARLEALR